MQIITKLIKDLNVTDAKLATSAVTTGKIASGAVTDVKLAASAKQAVLESKYVKAMVEATNFAAGSSTSVNFGTKFLATTGTNLIGGSTSAEGLVVNPTYNLCSIRLYSDKSPIEDATGNDVYGRVTDTSISLTGTTDWSNGDATVFGTDTDFSNEVAANDILVGPDGLLYRVLSVTSGTELELTTNFAGTTASGQTTVRHRITLSYYSLVSNVETAYTMAGQVIDVQYPESYDLHSLPFNALTTGVAWTDITGPADHNHDDRYFTESELGASSETTGADRIGFDDTGLTHITATNVQDALADLDSAISGAEHLHAYEKITVEATNDLADLAYTPIAAAQVVLIVGGVPQRYGADKDYTVTGKVITWNNSIAGFDLATDDEVWAVYAHTGA